MESQPGLPEDVVRLDTDVPVWGRVFSIAPLVVVGTREGDRYDLAPKHMAFPLGWDNYFGFVCSPRHATYHNAKRARGFTVSYPRPDQLVLASLAAAPRHGWEGEKPILDSLPIFPAERVDGPLLKDAYFYLECELYRIVDGFGPNSLVVGKVVGACAHRDALRLSEEDDEELLRRHPLLAYVDPGRYAEIDRTHAFPLPEGFKK